MEENGYFLTLLQEQPFIKSVIENLDFSKIDLKNLEFNREDEDTYNFKNISVGEHQFINVKVSIRRELTSIKMVTEENAFFDEPLLYFNQEGFAHEIEPLLVNNVPISNMKRKLRTFYMAGRAVDLLIYKSDAYGCIIKLIIPDAEKINRLMNSLES